VGFPQLFKGTPRAVPDIIEFFLYRTMNYFLDGANAAHAAMQDPQKVYSTWMTEYLNKKTEGCSCSQSLLTTSTS
jgi:hypothetical protein